MKFNKPKHIILGLCILSFSLGFFQLNTFAQHGNYQEPTKSGKPKFLRQKKSKNLNDFQIPSPEVSLTDNDKIDIGKTENAYFEKVIANRNFSETADLIEATNANKKRENLVAVEYFVENKNDSDMEQKFEDTKYVISRGLKILLDQPWDINFLDYLKKDNRGIALLTVYIIKDGGAEPNLKHIAIKRRTFENRDYDPTSTIIIRNLNYENPNSKRFGKWDNKIANFLHDIGHLLHERNAGEYYWTINNQKAKTGSSVSSLAEVSKREFVAEMFVKQTLGQILSKEAVADSFNEYDSLLGLKLARSNPQGLPRF
jgi:hypothetical protein